MEIVRSSRRACFQNFEIIQAMLKKIRLLKNKTSDGIDVYILRKYIKSLILSVDRNRLSPLIITTCNNFQSWCEMLKIRNLKRDLENFVI